MSHGSGKGTASQIGKSAKGGISTNPTAQPQNTHKPQQGHATTSTAYNKTDEEGTQKYEVLLEEIYNLEKTSRIFTDFEVRAMVTDDFLRWIFSKDLAPQHLEQLLTTPAAWHGTETYAQLIREKFAKVFLTFLSLKAPTLIFLAVDNLFLDKYLPVPKLLLQGPGVDAVSQGFIKAQRRWTVRIPVDGGHIDYGPDEVLPFAHVRDLGAGSEGRTMVYRSRLSDEPATYCVKVLHTNQDPDIVFEVASLRRLREVVRGHKHLIELHATYRQQGCLHLVTQPACDANLWDYLVNMDRASFGDENEFKFKLFGWMNCLASSTKYLHNHGILHHSLKPQNILVRGTAVLLTDFECAFTDHALRVTEYLAPEQRSVVAAYYLETKGDVFALACIFADLFVTASGMNVSAFREARGNRNAELSFTQEKVYSFAGNVAEAQHILQTLVGNSESWCALVSLISDMWKENPRERPGLRAVMGQLNGIKMDIFPERDLCCRMPPTPFGGDLAEFDPEEASEDSSSDEDDDPFYTEGHLHAPFCSY